MAEESMALLETLRKMSAEGEIDVLREGVRLLAQAIMEAEVTELTGLEGFNNPNHAARRYSWISPPSTSLRSTGV
jgi:transposase-like protein